MSSFPGRLLLLLALVLSFLAPPLAAQALSGPFVIETGEIAPYTIAFKSGIDIEGAAGEVVAAAIRKAGLEAQFSVEWVPWKRAQENTQAKPNTLIFPLTRTAVREPQYKWISVILSVNCYAFALDPALKIDTLDDVKKLRVGALAGSPPETEVIKLLGAGAIMDPVSDEDLNYAKLAQGRIQAWSTQDVVAAWTAKKAGADPAKLRRGVLFFNQQLWVAANLATKDSDFKILQKAIADYLKDPGYTAILGKYGVSKTAVGK